MWENIIIGMKKPRYRVFFVIITLIFLVLYTILDDFNGGYKDMFKEYGLYLVILNIIVNIIIAVISGVIITISTVFSKLTGKEGKGTSLTAFSFFFGLLTYGCTPCVIAFFATIGITFAVITLPLAGFPYKILSLIMVILGLLWLKHEIKNTKCKVKKYTS